MPSSTRITGATLFLRIGSTEFSSDIQSWDLSNEEADQGVVTFADAREGGKRAWKLTVNAVQSTETASFWSYVWANTGTTAAFTLSPHGNSSGVAGKPVFTQSLKIGPKPSLGGEAGATNEFTFETTFDLLGEPVKTPA